MKTHLGALALAAGMVLFVPQLSFGQFSPPPTPTSRCVANCDVYVPPPVPAGPSPEELRRQREARDSREAAEDAEDRGIDAFEKRNYAEAVRWFREALEYAPDDADLRAKLSLAESRLREQRLAQAARNTPAMQQLLNVREHSNAALPGADTREAQHGIDTAATRRGSLPVSAGAGRADPVVPAGRRTPAITAMETERTELRQRIRALEERLSRLDPGKDSVEIAKVKQERSSAESKVNYITFTITQELEKPEPTPGPAARP
jgi:hypothetical protein